MSKRILIIEEKEGDSRDLGNRLQATGASVVTVADPIAGIRQSQEIKPDLIILDLIIPGDAGYAVLERIRLSAETQKAAVVVLAGSGFPGAKDRILRCGISKFFEKPYELKTVEQELQKLIRAERTTPKIVVVDDDPMLVKMLQSRLSATGFDVVTVTDSEEALRIVNSEDPNLVITDILMPNVSGWKITQELKNNPRFKSLPIILLSSLIEKEGDAERDEIGDYFMSKPVMMDKLIAKVQEILSREPAA